MISVNQLTRTYIDTNGRSFEAQIVDYDTNKVIYGDIRNFQIHKGIGQSFEPASIFSPYADVQIDNSTQNIAGKRIKIQVGCQKSGDSGMYTIGTFYVQKPKRKGSSMTFSAVGSMTYKMGKRFNDSTKYTTTASLISALNSKTGVSISLDGLDNETIKGVDLSQYYCREIVSLIAGVYMGYATEDRMGNVVIRSFDKTTGNKQIQAERLGADPDFYETETIQGVEITSDDENYVEGSMINASLNNPLMTQALFDKYKSGYVGKMIKAYNASIPLGDFTLEGRDSLTITDRTGTSHTVIACDVTLSYDGGIKTEVSMPSIQDPDAYVRGNVGYKADNFAGFSGSGGGGKTVIEYNGPNAAKIFKIKTAYEGKLKIDGFLSSLDNYYTMFSIDFKGTAGETAGTDISGNALIIPVVLEDEDGNVISTKTEFTAIANQYFQSGYPTGQTYIITSDGTKDVGIHIQTTLTTVSGTNSTGEAYEDIAIVVYPRYPSTESFSSTLGFMTYNSGQMTDPYSSDSLKGSFIGQATGFGITSSVPVVS